MSGNRLSRRPAAMKNSRKKRNSRRSDDTGALTRKLSHTEKERTRHRELMQTLDELTDQVPLDPRIYKSKNVKLRRTIDYYTFLEETIHSMCARRRRRPPAHCNLFPNSRRHQPTEAAWAPAAFQKKMLPPAETHRARNDDAVVPDVHSPPQTFHMKQESRDWELYGISMEDWMAAGSSQQEASPNSYDQVVPTAMPNTSIVNITTDCVMSRPLVEAPEYFVVSSTGELISLGKLLH
ncbi:uncharacterized protein LOC144132823 [Amblyomma americanum]